MKKRILASLLVIIAGLITISDKLFHFHFENNFGYYDSQTLAWTFSQMFAPILLMFAFSLNPYKVSFTVPVYLYAVQIYFIFSSHINDKSLFNFYAIGTVFFFLVCVYVFNLIFKDEKSKDDRINALEALLDLHINLYAKK